MSPQTQRRNSIVWVFHNRERVGFSDGEWSKPPPPRLTPLVPFTSSSWCRFLRTASTFFFSRSLVHAPCSLNYHYYYIFILAQSQRLCGWAVVGVLPVAINRFVSELASEWGGEAEKEKPFLVSSWLPAKRRQSGAELLSVFRGDQVKRSEELAFWVFVCACVCCLSK